MAEIIRILRTSLEAHPELSSSQIYDWLRERYADLPDVDIRTVYNFTQYIRAKYEIARPSLTSPRQYMVVEETAYGEYAQVDFGETWMRYGDGRRVKIYFFAVELPSDIKGDYVKFEGRRYYMYDPSYIGAHIGMTMPRYRSVPAKIWVTD